MQTLNNTKNEAVPLNFKKGFDTQLQKTLRKSQRYEPHIYRQVCLNLSNNEISVDIKQHEHKADKRNGRRKSFSQKEILFLAKAWIEQFRKGWNQREKNWLNGIKEKLKMDRSLWLFVSTWECFREIQHVLAARR